MQRESVHELIADVFGPNVYRKDAGGWVSIHCPLAPWTHERGSDRSPSAGISVNDGVSIFNCFAAGTGVLTPTGTADIATLAGTTTRLLTVNGQWVDAPVRSFGHQKIVELHLSRNGAKKVIRTTAGHRWFARWRSSGAVKEKMTLQLRKGDVLLSMFQQHRASWLMSLEGIQHGIVFGDGSRHTVRSAHGWVNLYGEKQSLHRYFTDHHKAYEPASDQCREPHIRVSGNLGHYKARPEMWRTQEYLLGFLAGYLATDGCVSEKGDIILNSSDRGNLEMVCDICTRLQIGTYGIGQQYRAGYGQSATALYGLRFVGSSLNRLLFLREPHLSRFENRSPVYERLRWQVEAVVPTETVEEVFCATVPEHGAFTLEDNILTGNCFTCHERMPLPALLRKWANYMGDNLDELIAEVEEAGYLGPRTLQGWESGRHTEHVLQPLDAAIYMDLYDSAAGHPYLQQRGISDETARKLELLFDPSDPSDGSPRILFPVRGADGALYGFSGRDTSGAARLKVRDYGGLQKAQCLLGSHLIAAEGADKVLVVEGLFDYANAWQQGYPAVAVMHSTMTEAQANIVRGLSLPTYLFYDNDLAGYFGEKAGAKIAANLLRSYVPTMKVRYPEIWIDDPSEEGGGHWLKDPGELEALDFEQMIADARLA